MKRIAAAIVFPLFVLAIGSCSDSDNTVQPAPGPTPTNSYEVSSGWTCAFSVDCQDVYDFTFTAGAQVTAVVSAVTGASVVRLALFAPGDSLGGTNLMMGANNDRMCYGQDESDSVVVSVPTTGRYRLAVGRDWGSSAGATGTYTLRVTSPVKFTVTGRTANDTPSKAAGTDCPFTSSMQVDGGWACNVLESCQDVYDVDVQAGTQLSISITNVTGSSVPRLAVFAPGVALSGTNLLMGAAVDRECAGQNGNENVVITAPTSGVYRIAVGRDWGSSAGATGTYRFGLSSDIPFTPMGQTADDMLSQATGSACPTVNYSVGGGWNCAVLTSCQNVYDFVVTASTTMNISVTSVTGSSVVRLALFGPGMPLSGTNLLNGSTSDRKCVGQDANDSASYVTLTTGVYRLAVGRDWGSSAGSTGTYSLSVTADLSFVPVGLTSNDSASQAAGTSCP